MLRGEPLLTNPLAEPNKDEFELEDGSLRSDGGDSAKDSSMVLDRGCNGGPNWN